MKVFYFLARLSALWTNTLLLKYLRQKKVQTLSFLAQICTNDIQHREDYGLNFIGPSIGVRNSPFLYHGQENMTGVQL